MSAPPATALQGAIHKLAFHEPLTAADAEAAFTVVMKGEATAVQVAALLSALRATGESPEVVAGVVRALRSVMGQVGPVRRELAIPTVMNIVGPLANPARAGRQVVGVADLERTPILAGALSALGATHALVVHGEPGLDEVSPLGPTHVIEVRN